MKKSTRFLLEAIVCGMACLAVLAGCEYDVAEPLWEKPFTVPPTPAINQIEPAAAPPGVNTILITGQNLGGVPNTNGVYFNTTSAEVVQKSATAITVRRPALVADSCTVTVVSDSALVVKKVAFGRIDLVMDRFGGFRDNIMLGAVVVDSVENLYVVSGVSPVSIWKVAPNGDKTTLTTSGIFLRPPYDARTRNGVLYLLGNNREIQQVNLTTGVVSRWTQLPPGKVVKVGDFDASGYFYTGGVAGSDLCIVPPNPPTSLSLAQITLAGSYTTDEILAVRVYNGYVYVASRSGSNPAKIWRHAIGTGGQVGAQELVVDLGTNGSFSSRFVRDITFSATGVMYLTTDFPDPLLVFNPGNNSLDYFYKSIVPPNGTNAFWGRGNYLYMISGDAANADPGLRWNVARINMGTTGAPYY